MEVPVFDEAVGFENNSSGQIEDGQNLIKLLAPEKGDKILDIGCATGYLTKVLTDLVGPEGKVTGIDPDLKRLELAREKYSAINTEYLEGCAENVTGSDYDIVYSNYVIHWCKDKDLVFSNVYKSLKLGGKFGFVVNTYFDCVEKFFTPSDMFSSEFMESVSSRLFMITEDELKLLASKHKFEVLYMEGNQVWKFSDFYKYVEFLMIHTYGEFDSTHFNIHSLKHHYGQNEVVLSLPFVTAVLHKS